MSSETCISPEKNIVTLEAFMKNGLHVFVLYVTLTPISDD